MERSIQQIIDTAAGKLFQVAIPNEWVIRDQQQTDYGIDYEIEVFEKGKSTGIIFKIQLKGTKNIRLLKDKNIISHSFSINNIKYYLEEVQIPIIVVIVDIQSNTIYWHNPLLDKELSNTLQQLKNSSQESLTVHIDSENQLPKDIQRLLYEYNKSMYFISARFLTKKDDLTFSQIISSLNPDANTINEFQNKVDLLKLDQILQLIQTGDYQAAVKIISSIINSNESTVQTKFQSILFAESIEINEAFGRGESKDELFKINLNFANVLKGISRKAPDQLRIYAMANLLSIQLQLLIRDEFTYFMNWKLNEKDNDFIWLNTVHSRRLEFVKSIQIKYFQIKRILNIALEKKIIVIVPDIIIKMVQPLSIYLQRMRQENLDKAVDLLQSELFEIGEIGIIICKSFNNKKELSGLIYNLLMLSDIGDESDYEKIETMLFELIKDVDDDTKNYITSEISALKGKANEMTRKKDAIEEEVEIYKNMARAFRIDLTNDTDDISKVINIGINDINPERVLKNCRNLFVMLQPGGAVSEWMKLPTAAFKSLICTKHKYRLEAISLDGLYETFKIEHCNKCPNKEPHPIEWKWSREWQLEQNELYKKNNPKS